MDLLEGKALVLMPQSSKMEKTLDEAVAISDEMLSEVSVPEARVTMLRDEVHLLEHWEKINCDLEVGSRNISDAQGNITDLATVLHRNIMSLFDGFRSSFEKTSLVKSQILKKSFDREALSLQTSVRVRSCQRIVLTVLEAAGLAQDCMRFCWWTGVPGCCTHI